MQYVCEFKVLELLLQLLCQLHIISFDMAYFFQETTKVTLT